MGLHSLGRPDRERLPEIPGYRLEAVIGRGSTGVVYRARQIAVDRAVALKVLHEELTGKGNAIRRLQREARTTARLAHPSIVSAIDMGETRGQWWYAMELVDGESLSQRLRTKGKLAEREALRLFIPLCEALQHAHEHGVVHRDIKPANILVDLEGRPHLVDLGLALAEDDPAITRHGGTLGTPHYISPEQARDPGSADIRSDIWSLGATFYHALCGRPPFEGSSVAEILSGVLYARIVDPQELAPNLSRGSALVLRKCLSRAPDRRYQAPREMLEDLELLRERRDVKIRASTLDPVATQGSPWVRVWIAVGAAVLFGSAAAIAWWPRDKSSEPRTTNPTLSTTWPELERAAEKGARSKEALAGALTELEQLKPAVPERFAARYEQVSGELLSAYHVAIDAFAHTWTAEVDGALHARDYVRALELADADRLERRLRETFAPNSRQMQELHDRIRDGEETKRVNAALDDELERDAAALEARLDQRAKPDSTALRSRGGWKSARAALIGARDAALAERRAAPRKVPKEFDARLEARADKIFAPALAELDRAWAELDQALASEFSTRADDLEQTLRGRTFEGDPKAEIERAFDDVLGAQNVAPNETLDDVSRRARDAFENRAKQLLALKESVDEEDAQTWAFTTDGEAREAWKSRDYDLVRARWELGRGEPWIGKIAERMEVEIQWATLLGELLQRAADAVRERNGTRLELLVGTIKNEGSINSGSDPLANGFGFRTGAPAKERWLALKHIDTAKAEVLGADAIERLAGLPQNSSDILQPKDRLLRTLFRYREGDLSAALATFRSGPLPRDVYPALCAEIERRLNQSATAFAEEKAEKLVKAQKSYNLIQRTHSESGSASFTLQRIDALLADYGDLDWVQQRRAELEQWKAQLAAPTSAPTPGTLVERFSPSELEIVDGRARLTWEFGADRIKGWESDWVRDRDAWHAPSQHSKEDLYVPSNWPRFALGDAFNLDGGVETEVEFVQPAESGPPQLVVISVGGWHVAFAGARQRGEHGYWKAASGDAQALRSLVDDVLTGKGTSFGPLETGKSHTVRLVLRQSRGVLETILDTKSLGSTSGTRPKSDVNTALVVRSLEVIELKRASLKALAATH